MIIFFIYFVIIYQNTMHGREVLRRNVFHLIRAYKKSTHRGVTCSVPIIKHFAMRTLFLPQHQSPSTLKGISVNLTSMAETNKAAVEVFEGDDLAVALAKYVADLSNKFTSERGAFTVCLSGGSMMENLRWVIFLIKMFSL